MPNKEWGWGTGPEERRRKADWDRRVEAKRRAIEVAAIVLHDEACEYDTGTCPRWNSKVLGGYDPQRHIGYYEDRAREVLEAAAPHLAAAWSAEIPTGIIRFGEGGKLSETDVEELAQRWKAAGRTGEYTILPDDTGARIAEAVAAERERCAQLAEHVSAAYPPPQCDHPEHWNRHGLNPFAALLREAQP